MLQIDMLWVSMVILCLAVCVLDIVNKLSSAEQEHSL